MRKNGFKIRGKWNKRKSKSISGENDKNQRLLKNQQNEKSN